VFAFSFGQVINRYARFFDHLELPFAKRDSSHFKTAREFVKDGLEKIPEARSCLC
jgi:hypothetical protein